MRAYKDGTEELDALMNREDIGDAEFKRIVLVMLKRVYCRQGGIADYQDSQDKRIAKLELTIAGIKVKNSVAYYLSAAAPSILLAVMWILTNYVFK